MDEILVQFLTKTLNTIESAEQFVGEQLPDYVTQLLNWYFAYYLILFVIGLVCTISIAVFVIKKQHPWVVKNFHEFPSPLSYIPTAFLFLLSIIPMNIEWLKIWIAPKVWLVDYVRGIVQ